MIFIYYLREGGDKERDEETDDMVKKRKKRVKEDRLSKE